MTKDYNIYNYFPMLETYEKRLNRIVLYTTYVLLRYMYIGIYSNKCNLL